MTSPYWLEMNGEGTRGNNEVSLSNRSEGDSLRRTKGFDRKAIGRGLRENDGLGRGGGKMTARKTCTEIKKTSSDGDELCERD